MLGYGEVRGEGACAEFWMLTTADLRLSVLVDAGAVAAQGCKGGVRASAGTGGVVDGALRAHLDPEHARRIVAISDEGDRAVVALKAC